MTTEADVGFAKELLVLIGGVIAIAASLASQLMIHHFTSHRERTKIFREKAEHLVRAICQQSVWMDKKQRHLLFDFPDVTENDPVFEVMTLCHLYFPSANREMEALLESLNRLNCYCYDQKTKRLTDHEKWMGEFSPDDLMENYWEPYRRASGNLIGEIAKKMPQA